MTELCTFCDRRASSIDVFAAMANMVPRLVWGQARGMYPLLSALLVCVFTCPPSAAAGERNHKTRKAVLTRTRASLSAEKTEMQSAIAFNSAQMVRSLSVVRDTKFDKALREVLGALSTDAQEVVEPVTVETEAASDEDAFCDCEDDGVQFDGLDIDRILDSIVETMSYVDIPDRLLFGEEFYE